VIHPILPEHHAVGPCIVFSRTT